MLISLNNNWIKKRFANKFIYFTRCSIKCPQVFTSTRKQNNWFCRCCFPFSCINKLQAPWWASIQNNSIQQVFHFCGFLVWFGFHPCASCGGPHFSITLHYNRVNYMTHIIQTAIAPSSRHEPVISVLLPITSIRLQAVRLLICTNITKFFDDHSLNCSLVVGAPRVQSSPFIQNVEEVRKYVDPITIQLNIKTIGKRIEHPEDYTKRSRLLNTSIRYELNWTSRRFEHQDAKSKLLRRTSNTNTWLAGSKRSRSESNDNDLRIPNRGIRGQTDYANSNRGDSNTDAGRIRRSGALDTRRAGKR